MSVIGVALAAPVLGAAVPPITAPATQEHHRGKVVFQELITPDLKAAEQFYAALLGWHFVDVSGLRYPYAQAYSDGVPVAGLVEKPMPAGAHLQSAWLDFLSVTDVDGAAKAASAAGGKIMTAAHDVSGRGREAVLQDPQGAVFAVLASSSGDQPDTLTPVGGWIWNSMDAQNPDQDARFYQAVFGYEIDPYPDTRQGHAVLASDGYARASFNALPPDHPGAHAHWLGFVRVADTPATLAKLGALGGHVLAGPWVDRHGGRMAIIADPAGAPFGLMEWPADDSKGAGR